MKAKPMKKTMKAMESTPMQAASATATPMKTVKSPVKTMKPKGSRKRPAAAAHDVALKRPAAASRDGRDTHGGRDLLREWDALPHPWRTRSFSVLYEGDEDHEGNVELPAKKAMKGILKTHEGHEGDDTPGDSRANEIADDDDTFWRTLGTGKNAVRVVRAVVPPDAINYATLPGVPAEKDLH